VVKEEEEWVADGPTVEVVVVEVVVEF